MLLLARGMKLWFNATPIGAEEEEIDVPSFPNKQPISWRRSSLTVQSVIFFGMLKNQALVIESTLVVGLAHSEMISLKAFYA